MSSSVKTFLFAAVLCVVCSFALTFAATYLKPFQEANALADKQKNVMKVLGLLEPGKKYSVSEVQASYTQNVKVQWMSADGSLDNTEDKGDLPLYQYIKDGQLKSYAIPISGYGLWSTLYGFFALEADGATVAGITFYQHGETPGLGAECEKPWFQNNFVGKKIVDNDGNFVSITISKGATPISLDPDLVPNTVDGISGATVTAKGIDTFLRKDLQKYEVYSSQLRNN